MSKQKPLKPATLLASAGHFRDGETGGLVPPIHTSTTYARDAAYALPQGRLYMRDDSPVGEQAEAILAALDGGADAALFSSGLAAMAALAALLGPSDGVVLANQCYFGVRSWLMREAARVGFRLHLFDVNEEGAMERAVEGAAKEGPVRLLWVESPANPTWEVVDIERAAALAHGAGAKLVVDATAASPLICRPLALGADIVMHSATKYLNGHADVVAGALVSAAADDDWAAVKDVRYRSGAILGPFEAWLLIRGLRTLNVRLRACSANALAIARHFEGHKAISHVLYPGLESHSGHAIAVRQWDTGIGFSGMLSFRLSGGEAAAHAFALGTRLFQPATSLGGVESLIEHRKAVEEASSPVPADLVRLSVGIEDVGDLIDDLEAALSVM